MKVKPTQSRGGVKGGTSSLFVCPLHGQGTASLVGFGATPHLFLVKPTQRKKSTRRRQRSVPASNFALPQERPPKLLYQLLAHCRAKWARPNCLTSVSVCFPRTSSSIHHQKQTSTALHHAGLFFILLTFPAHPGWSAWAAPGLCPECTPGMPRSPADRHSPSR